MLNVNSVVAKHDEWRLRNCVNLIPSENVTSPEVRKLLSSDMGHRYTLPIRRELHGSFVENAYGGTRYLDIVEDMGESLAREIFEADFASLKPLSGHISCLAMLLSVCSPGDKILTISPKDGGYDGYAQEYMPQMLSLRADYLPFDEKRGRLDESGAAKMIVETAPKLVVVGSSFITFPYDLPLLKNACETAGAVLGYDASHVLGLIAGKHFQRPFQEGADIVVGSTHKSFFGPQGGIFLTNSEEIFQRMSEQATWRLWDNVHWNRVAALVQALIEAKEFGKEYAEQVIRNSSSLAWELDDLGFPLKYKGEGFTACHQIIVDSERLKREYDLTLSDLCESLEKNDIIIDAVGRIGTGEITRLGAEEEEMRELAELIVRSARGEKVKERVRELRFGLKMRYCFGG